MTFLVLHHVGGNGGELLINAEHISAVTADRDGARIHMHVTTGLSWGVRESYDEVKRMLSMSTPTEYTQPPKPPTIGVT